MISHFPYWKMREENDFEEKKEMLIPVMQFGRNSSNEHDFPDYSWKNACPEDAFVYSFSFLKVSDLSHLASVSKAWKTVACDASLWLKLDLSHVWWKVNDRLVIQLLSSSQFGAVEYISLEGCIEITDVVVDWITDHCEALKVLLLTNCCKVSPAAVMDLVNKLHVKTLELEGVLVNGYQWRLFRHIMEREDRQLPNVMKCFNMAIDIKQRCPGIKMPLFWKRACAVMGLDLDTGEEVDVTMCRHAAAFQDRQCWGERCQGRLIYSNTFYPRPGNYPSEVLYSCTLHHEKDLTDDNLFLCEVCRCLFRRDSMQELICNVCYDKENLRDKRNWIVLQKKSTIHDFGLSDIFSKSLKMANPENLPHTLKVHGSASCRLDYTIPNEEKFVDPEHVPVDMFMSVNQQRMRHQMDLLKESLKDAEKEGETRALLFVNSRRELELMADKHPMVDGRRGEFHLKLVINAWHTALRIIYPFLVVIAVVTIFVYLMKPDTKENQNDYTEALAAGREEPISPKYVLLIACSFVFGILVGCCMAWRFRELCLKFLKLMIFLNLLLCMLLGSYVMLTLIVSLINEPFEIFSALIIIWNFSAIGMYCLYNVVPSSLHCFFLSGLFIVMAIMIAGILNIWFVFFFVSMYAFGDILTWFKPQWQFLTDFFLPPSVMLQVRAPRILYSLDGVAIRSMDMLWYGLIIGLFESKPTVVGLISVAVILMASLCLVAFVFPIFGTHSSLRPIPLAFGLTLLLMLIITPLTDFNFSRNHLDSTAIEIPASSVYESFFVPETPTIML